jgi:hypothetical protein
MGNGALATGPKLPRPSSTPPGCVQIADDGSAAFCSDQANWGHARLVGPSSLATFGLMFRFKRGLLSLRLVEL